MIEPGQPAPDFELPDQDGTPVQLSGFRGRRVVLYFYPKADTPGCTKEACAFQEALPQLGRIGLAVIGVSRDPIGRIDRFAEKYGLKFPLASDPGDLSGAYGTWVEKSMYGRTYMGMERATFLIDAKGRVAKIWNKVKIPGHAEEVMAAGTALG
jgi:thioredoxin-dependent peroxiredoxin